MDRAGRGALEHGGRPGQDAAAHTHAGALAARPIVPARYAHDEVVDAERGSGWIRFDGHDRVVAEVLRVQHPHAEGRAGLGPELELFGPDEHDGVAGPAPGDLEQAERRVHATGREAAGDEVGRAEELRDARVDGVGVEATW